MDKEKENGEEEEEESVKNSKGVDSPDGEEDAEDKENGEEEEKDMITEKQKAEDDKIEHTLAQKMAMMSLENSEDPLMLSGSTSGMSSDTTSVHFDPVIGSNIPLI